MSLGERDIEATKRGGTLSVRPMSRLEIERRARTFVEAYHPDALTEPQPFPVLELFDFDLQRLFGIQTDVRDLPADVEAMTLPEGVVVVGTEVYEQLVAGEGRARFTVLHEVGHAVLHAGQVSAALVAGNAPGMRRDRSEVPAYRNAEWQADVFAGEALAPLPAALAVIARPRRSFMGVRLSVEEDFAEVFGESRAAASVRLKVLRQQGIH